MEGAQNAVKRRAAQTGDLVLRAVKNNLTVLPESLFQLKELQGLDIWANRLSELPAAIDELDQLWELDVSKSCPMLSRFCPLPWLPQAALPKDLFRLGPKTGLSVANSSRGFVLCMSGSVHAASEGVDEKNP